MKYKGFTLIELLVVIAIIALLAGILFPVFSSVRENGRKASCLSNERQLSTAILMYVQDHDESFPRWNAAYITTPNQPDVPEMWWKHSIAPYVKSGIPFVTTIGKPQHQLETGVWHCPSSDRYLDGQDWLGGNPPPTKPSTASYGMNMFLAYNFFGDAPQPPFTRYYTNVPLAALRAPADTILLGEAGLSGRIGSPLQHHWKAEDTLYNNSQVRNWERPAVHFGGSNYVFCDGHIKYLKAEHTYPTETALQKSAALKYFVATEEDHAKLSKP
jgi:prepilin-type N-terminal cleavage/methylation domain-containing protein/prepilin-type processing-associated H-X9-DG protein